MMRRPPITPPVRARMGTDDAGGSEEAGDDVDEKLGKEVKMDTERVGDGEDDIGGVEAVPVVAKRYD